MPVPAADLSTNAQRKFEGGFWFPVRKASDSLTEGAGHAWLLLAAAHRSLRILVGGLMTARFRSCRIKRLHLASAAFHSSIFFAAFVQSLEWGASPRSTLDCSFWMAV